MTIESEPRITGLSFTGGGYHRMACRAAPAATSCGGRGTPRHWLFAGTDLRYGGSRGLHMRHHWGQVMRRTARTRPAPPRRILRSPEPDVYRDGDSFDLPSLTRPIAVDEIYDDILDGDGRSLLR